MRSIVILTTATVILAWVVIRHLPDTEANAEAAVNLPIERMQQVRSISFDGVHVPSALLRGVLETHPGDQLDLSRLERDRSAMEKELASRGYLAARVDAPAVTFDAAGAAYLTFEVDKGPMFHLRQVAVTGPGKDAAVITISSGDDAVRDRIDRAREALSDGLTRRGKPAKVDLSVRTDLASASVDIVLATQ